MRLQNELDMVDNIFTLEIKVKELEAQIESLKQELLEERASYEAQFQRMKCCENCKNHYLPKSCVDCDDTLRSWELRE